MAFGGNQKGSLRAEINVTPLVDVVLVLLIIFMVVTPMLHRGKDLELPTAHKSDEENKKADPIVVSLTTEGTLYIENDEVTADQLVDATEKALAKDPDRKFLLKGDVKLTVGDVREVMDKIRRGGAKTVELGVKIEGAN
ncbi:MAG: biopolymer transporter ExbD [Polyangiaceae bacterium]